MSTTDLLFNTPATPALKGSVTNYKLGINLLNAILPDFAQAPQDLLGYLCVAVPAATIAAEKTDGLPVTRETLLKHLSHPRDMLQLLTPSPQLPAQHLQTVTEYLLNHGQLHQASMGTLSDLPQLLVSPDEIPLALYNPIRIRVRNFLSMHPLQGEAAKVALASGFLAEACVLLSSNHHSLKASAIIALFNSDVSTSGHLVNACPDGRARYYFSTLFSGSSSISGADLTRLLATENFYSHYI